MKLKGIFALVMLGLAVPGKTAQVLDQSLASQESRKVRQQKVEPFSEADRAETGSVPLQAQPQIDLQTFSLSSGTSIDVSESWIEREQMPLPPSPRLARLPGCDVLGVYGPGESEDAFPPANRDNNQSIPGGR
jgi:hypothetical protein